MREVLLLLLQAVAGTPPERIDLTQPAATAGCERPTGEEIVVCGGRANLYRLQPLPPRPEPTLIPKAETGLFGGAAVGAVETEAVQMPGGVQSNRLMARVRLPF